MAISAPTSRGADFGQFSVAAQSLLATADQTIKQIAIPRGARRLLIEVKNVGSFAFDAFTIQRRPNSSAAWQTVASINTDYSSFSLPLLEVAGAPVTLAAGQSVVIRMDVEATDAVRFAGSSGPPVTTIDVFYRLQ